MLIAGGSSADGFALAKSCIECGAAVTIVGRNPEQLKSAAKRLGEPTTLRTVAADITQEQQVLISLRRCSD